MNNSLLTPEKIQSYIDEFNENQNWNLFNNIPPIQMINVVHPFYIRRFAFPSKQFGNITTQEALVQFNATTAMLEEFQRLSLQWERFANAQSLIGKQVRKRSGKPFKCKGRIVTVKSVIEHPFRSKHPAFIFEEDDSFVSADQCQEVKC